MTQADKIDVFRKLHQSTFLLPNVWDAASAVLCKEAGFSAIGTSSAGVAFSLGYRDGQRIPAAEMIRQIRHIVRVVDAPVSADIEAGYDDPVITARAIWDAGAVGINLEDVTGDTESTQVPLEWQTATLARIRAEVPELFINARTDIFLMGIGVVETRLERTIERLRAFHRAGADCLFVPGVKDPALIRSILSAVDGPVNILATAGSPSLQEFRSLGVSRVSVGSGPMRAAMGTMRRIAEELLRSGTYEAMTENAIPYAEANALFEKVVAH